MTNKLKLMQIAVCLAGVCIASQAEDLETKSGKIFNNYTITGRKGSNVTVSHAGGVTSVPISEIPDRIVWPWVKSEVEEMIYAAKRANTLDQTERKLREIVRQYPASKEMVEKELVQVQKKKEIENQISAILSSGNMDEQLGKLRKLLEKHRENPELERRLDYQIAVQTSKQKKLADMLAQKMQEAEKERDPEMALNQLRALLKEHPNHPYSAKQQEYEERMNRLISAKEADYKKYQARRLEIRQHLQGIWQLQFSEKRTLWQRIFKSHYAVERALTKARALQEQESYDPAIAEVEKIIRQEPRISAAAGAQNLLKTLVNQRDELLRKQRRLAESREAVKRIRFNDSNQSPQIIVRKRINVENNCVIWVFPEDRRNDILELNQTLVDMWKSWNIHKKLWEEYKQGDRDIQSAELSGTTSYTLNLRRQNLDRLREANVYFSRVGSFRRKAETALSQESRNKSKNGGVFTGSCNLSNITRPVILFAFEKITSSSGLANAYQSWYMEYTPTSQTVNWNLE